MTASKILLLAMTASALALSACGRKSGLDTPYQAQVDAREAAEDEGRPVPPAPEKPVEDKPFILDALIE